MNNYLTSNNKCNLGIRVRLVRFLDNEDTAAAKSWIWVPID